ncbi:MAG TPA: SRPBCC domain-containing protein [Myxococcaceae bacterium]
MARLLETERLLIEAPAEIVWSTLTDFASHQTWDSYVVTWEGEAKVGSRMRLVAMADRRREFVPIVTEVVPARLLRYEHRVLGGFILRAEHEMIIEPVDGASRCRFFQRERFTGLVVPMAWKAIQSSAGPGFERMNRDLKTEAEKRFRGT